MSRADSGMTMTRTIPPSAFDWASPDDFQVGDRRQLSLFGSPVTLLWLPDRKNRPGVPKSTQPVLRPNRADRIVAEESLWEDRGCVLTPNRFPFAQRELLLWAKEPTREPTLAMFEVAFTFEEVTGCATLLNSMGAAASISRSHVHFVAEPSGFLASLATEPVALKCLEDIPDVEVVRLAPPCPILVLGVRGTNRAKAVHRLLELRSALAFNLASEHGTTWIMPRSSAEIPTPHFPHAFGGAELWGQWCFAERDTFDGATEQDLEAALKVAGWPRDSSMET